MKVLRMTLAAAMTLAATTVLIAGCGREPASWKPKATQDQPADDPDLDPDPIGEPVLRDPIALDPEKPSLIGAPEPWPSPLPGRAWPPLVWQPLPTYTPIPSSNIATPAPTPVMSGPSPMPTATPRPMPTPTPLPPPPAGDPPAGWQPQTPDEFYMTLRKFGYSRSREEAFARVRLYVGIEKPQWSPRAAKQLDAKYRKARTFMDPAPITLAYYDAQAKDFASQPNAYYVRTDYSFRQGADLIVIKADPRTRESLAYNLLGQMTYFTQLRAMQGAPGISYRHAIRVPPELTRAP